MKKVLIASTALVAAGLMTTGTASASEKIKLNLGGFSKWWVVGAWNDDGFQSTASTSGGRDYNNVDVKGDNEIFFGGSTTLDNGMKVGVDVQLEAGGHTDQTTDTIDESYVWIEGGFGKFIVGSENNGTYLLHVSAPDAAANWGEGGIMTGNFAIAKPTTVNGMAGGNTTAIATDGDADKITYVAPTFYGLTVGASYVPNGNEDNRGATQLNTLTTASTTNNIGEVYGVGALYANTFGGVGVKVSAGAVWGDLSNGAGRDWFEQAYGAQLSYAGFTLGGSFRQQRLGEDSVDTAGAASSTLNGVGDGQAWDVGLQYASGPYAISLAYFNSKVKQTTAGGGFGANSEEDEITAYQLSGKYTLGAGVDVLASVGHIEYDEAAANVGTAQNDNKGWTVMTGLSLAF